MYLQKFLISLLTRYVDQKHDDIFNPPEGNIVRVVHCSYAFAGLNNTLAVIYKGQRIPLCSAEAKQEVI